MPEFVSRTEEMRLDGALSPVNDAPRDKRTYFREINYIAAAFQYLKKNYNSV